MEASNPAWEGHEKMDRMFIFGDSYSSILEIVTEKTLPSPTADMPLGVPSPGFTYSSGEIWVGYLAMIWPSEKPLLIYDLAQGGDTVKNMERIVNEPYQELINTRSQCNKHWKPANTLFVFWIGINDLAYASDQEGIDDRLAILFGCVQTVYDSGARAFLFIDVPPMNRGPLIVKNQQRSLAVAPRFNMWNTSLDRNVQQFSKEHSDACCFQFSAFNFLTRVLDDPTKHGFAEEDPRKYGGGIWVDHIHLTSLVHERLAEDMREFLMTI